MKENMLDVLLYLFEYCDEDELRWELGEAALHHKLVNAGFQNDEIFKAFSWLSELSEQTMASGALPGAGSSRVFSRYERLNLPVDCRGLLVQLEQFMMIDTCAREQIIERALALEVDDLDLDHFKWVIMMVLLNQDKDMPSFIWMDEYLLGDEPVYLH